MSKFSYINIVNENKICLATANLLPGFDIQTYINKIIPLMQAYQTLVYRVKLQNYLLKCLQHTSLHMPETEASGKHKK